MKKLQRTFKSILKEENEETAGELPDSDASADRQILKIIMDAERQAVKSGKQQASMTALESIRRKNMRFLLEQEEKVPPLDVGTFGIEIMRVIKNFDTILDIPSIIIKRAEKYLLDKYGKNIAKSFVDYVNNEFDFSTSDENDDNEQSHLAIGAIGGGGGGGAV